MLVIPLYFFLIAYLIFLTILFGFAVVNALHLARVHAVTATSVAITVGVTIIVTGVVGVTFFLLGSIDWQVPVTVFNLSWFTGTFFNQPSL